MAYGVINPPAEDLRMALRIIDDIMAEKRWEGSRVRDRKGRPMFPRKRRKSAARARMLIRCGIPLEKFGER